jgi:hypothetical protein
VLRGNAFWTVKPFGCIGAALGVLACAASPLSAQTSSNKIDRALQDALLTGAATQRVIISVKPGYRASVRQALQAHGDLIKSDHPSIDAFSAEIHSADVSELARQPWIDGVSIDATVYPVGERDDRDARGNGKGRCGEGGGGSVDACHPLARNARSAGGCHDLRGRGHRRGGD